MKTKAALVQMSGSNENNYVLEPKIWQFDRFLSFKVGFISPSFFCMYNRWHALLS